MMTIDGINYLSVAEACELLGVKAATIYAYVSRGTLHSYKQGIKRQRLYREDEVRALLAVQPGEGSGAKANNEEIDERPEAIERPEANERVERSNGSLPLAEGWISEL